MSEELRAAAKRLLAEAVAYRENNGWPDHDYPELAADMESVSRACLAENPADDGEAVTEGWLLTIPGAEMMSWGVLIHGDYNFQYFMGSRSFKLDCSRLMIMPTRGHVRRLLAALGIPITPPG